jgi:hypothetical protein
MLSTHAVDQAMSLPMIVDLSEHQADIDRVVQCACQSQYFCRYAALGTSDGLAKSPPSAP